MRELSQPVYSHYRQLRKGLLGGLRLEEHLRADMKWLSSSRERGALSEVESSFARLSIEAVDENYAEALVALEDLFNAAEKKGLLDDSDAIVDFIGENLTDDEVRQGALDTLAASGGVRSYLAHMRHSLEFKRRVLSRSLEALETEAAFPDFVPSVPETLTIGINLDAMTREELKAWYKKKWEELQAEEKGSTFYGPQSWQFLMAVCARHPDIARELDLPCPTDLFGIVVGAILIILGVVYYGSTRAWW